MQKTWCSTTEDNVHDFLNFNKGSRPSMQIEESDLEITPSEIDDNSKFFNELDGTLPNPYAGLESDYESLDEFLSLGEQRSTQNLECERPDFPYSCYIFNQIDQTKEQKKNNNFPKFLVKLFFKMWHMDKQKLKGEWKNYNDSINYIRDDENIGLRALQLLLGPGSSDSRRHQRRNRQFLRKILTSDSFMKEIEANNYIRSPNKKQYMIACKVFAHRCRNVQLTSRYESR